MGEPDASGRRRCINSDEKVEIEVDTIVTAIGQKANALLAAATAGLITKEDGYIVVDQETGATNRQGIFAGGDIVVGPATVIRAVKAGKDVAQAIDQYLKS